MKFPICSCRPTKTWLAAKTMSSSSFTGAMSSTLTPESCNERRRFSHCCCALTRSMGLPMYGFLGSRTSKNVGGHINAVLGMQDHHSGCEPAIPDCDTRRDFVTADCGWALGFGARTGILDQPDGIKAI